MPTVQLILGEVEVCVKSEDETLSTTIQRAEEEMERMSEMWRDTGTIRLEEEEYYIE